MEQQGVEVPVSASGQFRSRITATVSQRRMNVSSREPSSAPARPIFSESPSTTIGPESYLNRRISIILSLISSTKRRWLFQLVIVACTINFTYDLILGQLHTVSDRDEKTSSVSPLESLSQPFRLSRLAYLHDPTKFEPFVISATGENPVNLNVTACLCITSKQLDSVVEHLVDWPGFVSLVVVHPGKMSSKSKKTLRGQLRSLAKNRSLSQIIDVHLFEHPQHIPFPYNSLMNLARFYAPTEWALLVPSFPLLTTVFLLLWPADTALSNLDGNSIIFMGEAIPSDNGEFEASSALLLRKSSGLWCPERFISMPGTQWKQCLWRAWLLSLGNFHFIPMQSPTDAAELLKGTSTTLVQDHILEHIDEMMIPKFRSETCIHMLRNLKALRQKEEAAEGPHSSPVFPPLQLSGACTEA